MHTDTSAPLWSTLDLLLSCSTASPTAAHRVPRHEHPTLVMSTGAAGCMLAVDGMHQLLLWMDNIMVDEQLLVVLLGYLPAAGGPGCAWSGFCSQ